MVRVYGLGSVIVDFGVLDHAGLVVLQEDEADGFLGVALADHFGGDGDVLRGGEAEEGGVRDFDEAVVDAVGVDVLDAALAHVGADGGR